MVVSECGEEFIVHILLLKDRFYGMHAHVHAHVHMHSHTVFVAKSHVYMHIYVTHVYTCAQQVPATSALKDQ